ncbi:MAG: RNA methyltransferase [Saprospiraceae bacterium]
MFINKDFKWVKKLHNKSFRIESRLYLAEGSRLVLDMVLHNSKYINRIFATTDWINHNVAKLQNIQNIVHPISYSQLKSIASLKSTEEVLAVMNMPEPILQENLVIPTRGLYLYQIQDPGNFGTMLRTADWFGLSIVFCSENCADPFNNKSVQASMSSVARISIIECHAEELKSRYGYRFLLGTEMHGQNYKTYSMKENSIMCFGNEANGLPQEFLELCDERLSIPSNSLGSESLNVSIAAGILMSNYLI